MAEQITSSRPSFMRRTAVRFQTITQLFGALWRGPFWWLIPFAVILVVFALLLIVLQAVPAAAPFVYALF